MRGVRQRGRGKRRKEEMREVSGSLYRLLRDIDPPAMPCECPRSARRGKEGERRNWRKVAL